MFLTFVVFRHKIMYIFTMLVSLKIIIRKISNMSLYKTAYDTTVGKGTVVTKVVSAIRETLILAPIARLAVDSNNGEDKEPIASFITGRNEVEKDIPNFIHPLTVEDVHHKKYLVSDIRSFIRLDANVEGQYIVRNASEFNLAKARLVMNKVWLTTGPQALSGMGMLPQNCFAAWISEGISHRFMLDPADQLRLAIIAHFYYQSLFYEEERIDGDLRNQFIANCVRSAGRVPVVLVMQTVEKIDKLESIQDFCETVKTILENPRLEQFNSGLLISILKSSWYGSNAADVLAVSLEHPPSWVSLIYIALSERTFRNANLTRLAERFAKGSIGDYYKRAFVSLAQNVTEEYSSQDSF